MDDQPEDKNQNTENTERIYQRIASSPMMGNLEGVTGIDRVHLALLVISSSLLLFLLIFGVSTFSQVAAFVYPAYKTYKLLQKQSRRSLSGALLPPTPRNAMVVELPATQAEAAEREREREKEREKQGGESPLEREHVAEDRRDSTQDQQIIWLKYWVVYGFFDAADYFVDRFLFWFPFYNWLKAGFLCWIFLEYDHSRGCLVLYDRFIRPFLTKHSTKIDQGIDQGLTGVSQASSEIMQIGSTALTSTLKSLVSPQVLVAKLTNLSLRILSMQQNEANQTKTPAGSRRNSQSQINITTTTTTERKKLT